MRLHRIRGAPLSTSSRLKTFNPRRSLRYHKYITVVGVPSAHHGHHKGSHFLLPLIGARGVACTDVTRELAEGEVFPISFIRGGEHACP